MEQRTAGLVALALAACGQTPVARPVTVTPRDAAAPLDGAPISDDEKLAAIQKAMNELAPASQECWAAVAAIRFDIDGELTAQIDIGPPARVAFVHDTTKSVKLAACMQHVLEAYAWPPPLRGQTIRLPFAYRAPQGQSVIDRRLVPFAGQGNVSVAVLLDDNNTGNAQVSMFELAIASGGTTGLRTAPRAELWWLRDPAELSSVALKPVKLAAGSLFYVPAGGAREVKAVAGDVHAVIVVAPGGAEGAARAGALPTPELSHWTSAPVVPRVLTPVAAKGHQIFLEDKSAPFSAALATIPNGTVIAEHVHAHESEMLYFMAGSGSLTIAGQTLPVTDTSVVQLPPNTKHAFTATGDVRALQIYAPGGPEQRFK
ncbi:MAG TPA: cupin domain-containing protein [Kofleriaceae bacterium]|nr:cupin domain-containing protein [Kofleriaceae bacterium]